MQLVKHYAAGLGRKVHAFSTFFYDRYRLGSHFSVRTHTKKLKVSIIIRHSDNVCLY